MHKIRILVLLSQISAIFMAEYFDHAFRKQEDKKLRSESRSINKDSSKLLKRVGLAMGEEDSESSQPMEEHKLLRRTGLQEDQDAVESVKSGMRQFSSGSKRKAVNKPRKINISDIPMEHRLREAPGAAYKKAGENARNLVVAATNTALLPSTVATYLTQMWIANIMQTFGWAIVGGLYSASTGRSFQETARMDESEDQAASQSSESVLKSIDSKTVASILRGLADAADSWAHTEL